MVFGVYGYGNNEAKKEVFRGMKIRESEMIHLSEASKLFQRLSNKDRVVIYSVRDFASVSTFYRFAMEVHRIGASLKIVNEHYLDIGNGKVWRDSVQAHINALIGVEQLCYERLSKGFKLNKSSIGVLG